MDADRVRVRTLRPVLAILTLIMLAFVTIRLVSDVPDLIAGRVPGDDYSRRYVQHPFLAYAHILPGTVYLIGALFQLNRKFREGHFGLHRRMGRILIPAGLTPGVFAVVFGSLFPFDATRHRRWMIRAFAFGLAVSTIRIWIGLFQGFGVLTFQGSFGVAFWLSFVMHALVAEAYLWWRPSYAGPRQ